MSHEATELCQLLVDEIYGELSSRIFGALTYHGRLSFGALALRSHLASRQLKHGLAVLIQQNLAFWSTSAEGTYYEADWRGAYNLIRRGKLISIVEGRHGEAAGEIASTLLTLGHAKVDTLALALKQLQAEPLTLPELEATTQRQKRPMESSGVVGKANGTTPLSTRAAEKKIRESDTFQQGEERMPNPAAPPGPGPETGGSLISVLSSLPSASLFAELTALIKTRFLGVVHESHFRSEADTLAEAELEIGARPDFKGKPNVATKPEFRDAVDQLFVSWKFGSQRHLIPKRQAPSKIPRGKKRALDSESRVHGTSKRARVTSSMAQTTQTTKRTLLDDDEVHKTPKRTRLATTVKANGLTDSSHAGLRNGSRDARGDEEHEDNSDVYQSDGEEMTERPIHVDENTVLDINHAQLDIALRNEHLVKFVQEHIGSQTAQVYASFLRIYEKYLNSCSIKSSIDFNDLWDLRHGPGVLTRDIAHAMTEFDASNCGIGPADPSQVDIKRITHARRDRKYIKLRDGENGDALSNEGADGDEDLSDFIEEDDDEEMGNTDYRAGKSSRSVLGTAASSKKNRDSHSTNPTSSASQAEVELSRNTRHTDAAAKKDARQAVPVQTHASVNGRPGPPALSVQEYTRQHMLILAEHPCQLVTYILGKHDEPERWTVDFAFVARRMRLSMLEETVQDRYGIHALRIVRTLQLKGKLDEKGLSSFSLMNPKSMRSVLTAMHEGGHLELQEIPRDNNRQPVKTMFYWFFDEDRCSRKVLEESYKTMANCLRRMKVEREAVQAIVDKANRLDVQGREDEFLSAKEQAELRTWRQKEEQLLGQLGRLDDLVGVLRDF